MLADGVCWNWEGGRLLWRGSGVAPEWLSSCPLPGCQNSGVKGHVGEPRGAPYQVEGREESWELWAPI